MRVIAAIVVCLTLVGCVSIQPLNSAAPQPTPMPSGPASPTPTRTPSPTSAPSTPIVEPSSTEQTVESNGPTGTGGPAGSPAGTPMDLRPLLTSGVTVYNLGDTTLFLAVSGIDPDTGKDTALATFQIEPEQFTRQAAIPLRLRFDFSFDQTKADALGSCTMDVADRDEVDFVVVPEGVVVTRNDVQPDDIAEMNVATSSLCTAGAQ